MGSSESLMDIIKKISNPGARHWPITLILWRRDGIWKRLRVTSAGSCEEPALYVNMRIFSTNCKNLLARRAGQII